MYGNSFSSPKKPLYSLGVTPTFVEDFNNFTVKSFSWCQRFYLYGLFLGKIDVKSVHKCILLPVCMSGTIFCYPWLNFNLSSFVFARGNAIVKYKTKRKFQLNQGLIVPHHMPAKSSSSKETLKVWLLWLFTLYTEVCVGCKKRLQLQKSLVFFLCSVSNRRPLSSPLGMRMTAGNVHPCCRRHCVRFSRC